jgi:flagellar biosynthesis protein FlhG
MAGRPRDQAAGLRRMLARDRLRVLAIDAGARGAGKTTTVLGIARAAAALGQRVVVLDQSAGEVAGALSLTWRWELAHLLSGEREWREVLLEGPGGIGVVPGAKGLAALAASGGEGAKLFGGFARLSARPDLVIVNLCTRRARTSCLLGPEAELLMVARAARASVTATYARIKEHVRRSSRRRFRLLVNGAGEAEARALHATMAEVVRRFLGAELAFGGAVAAGAAPGDARWDTLARALEGWPLAEFAA